MFKKRTIALLLALSMVAVLFAGCAGSGEEAPKVTEAPAPAATEAPAEAAGPYEHSFPLSDGSVTFTAITEHENMGDTIWYQAWEELTGVKVEWEYYADWATQLGVTMASGKLPDLIYYLWDDGLSKEQTYKYGKAGMFVDYSQYLDIMPNLSLMLERYPESLVAVQNEDGSIYCLPHYAKSLTSPSNILYYRTDMFEKAGVEAPTTVEELLDAAVALQEFYGKDNPDFIAFQPHKANHIDFLMEYLFPAFGPSVELTFGADENGQVGYGMVTDQYRHTLEFMNKLYNSGAFDKNIFSEDGSNSKPRILANNSAIVTFGTMYSSENFESGNYDVAVLEPLTSDCYDVQAWRDTDACNRAMMCISSECEDIETLVKWVDTLYAPYDKPLAEGLTGVSVWLGVEGETWDWADENHETYDIHVPEDFDGAATNYLSEHNCSNGPNIIFSGLNVSSPGLMCKGLGTRNQLRPYAVQRFPITFMTFTEDELMRNAEVLPDLDNYTRQMRAEFIINGVTDAKWDEYLSKISTLGIEDAVANHQAAYDRYLALQN